MQIAFVTQPSAPEVSADDALAVTALAAYGIEVVAVPWGPAAAKWGSFSAVVLRSCWDYYLRLGAFESWLQSLVRQSVLVINQAPLIFETLDKRYLYRLAAAGLPVVPMRYVPDCSQDMLTEAVREFDCAQWIVKPAVSAGAHATYRGTGSDSNELWPEVAPALAGRAVLVQPFLASIESFGELSLMYFDGTFSHAVRKQPAPGDFRVQAAFSGTTCLASPDSECIALGTRVLLEPWINRPPFARVDLVQGASGWEIMEVELIEPCLYLGAASAAPQRFAAALARALGRLVH
jgi:hypothetical protein